ncbi:MAG TPA: hypothetical protein VGP12_03655, partial [Nitrosospira sp.]|nr:hypothetical protein [Nitrosospira sp.]
LKLCPACGAEAMRPARFCAVCGKLTREGYQPLDTIRASYGLQGKHFKFQNNIEEPESLFEENKNAVSQTAWACVVYSMVPYLGILFIPFAFVIGGFGYAVSFRRPQLGGRKLAATCIGLTFMVLAVQIVLWWLLYVIPEIGI